MYSTATLVLVLQLSCYFAASVRGELSGGGGEYIGGQGIEKLLTRANGGVTLGNAGPVMTGSQMSSILSNKNANMMMG
ncbi:unnamed protein product, partial [Anisakis simplex]|uniref:Secreted protein n=1 Tax=Anisakis simplex TaxID=6269 RepID=A0A0M3J8J5_ANISI